MAVDTTISNQIYLSRDQIRNQIIEFMQYYLELENVDLAKSSFLSFIIDILSTLTSNLLFYETSVYREFFLTTASLPESVLNLSAFIGYNSNNAIYANAGILMTIPLGFEDNDVTFSIPTGFKFKAGSIMFTTYYTTTVNVVNNSEISVVVQDDSGNISVIPVSIDIENYNFSFIITVSQYVYSQQEFQIDSDLLTYQFTTVDIPITGQIASLTIELQDPNGSGWTTYNEFNSLYLMSATDYGFVSKRISTGRRIYFGNGLIGKQPLPGSTVRATMYQTEGFNGNVIASSINQGDKIYATFNNGSTKTVDYTCTNTSSAYDGKDEESIQEIKTNSIANLVALKRLVSQIDYNNVNIVIPYSPLYGAPLPVLKRSDIKCNEIQLYSSLFFNNELVPTRNEILEVDPSTTYIPRGTIIPSGSSNYLTLFDMNIDYINGSASYDYILYSMTLTPNLETIYNPSYTDVKLQTLDIYLDTTSGDAVFKYNYEGQDLTSSCILTVVKENAPYTMINNTTSKYFEYSFSPYTDFPNGDIILNFDLYSGSSQIATYSTNVTFRKSLNDFMMSNVFSDSTSCIVYDIPVVEEDYYNSIVKKDFELQVLQYMMSTLSFSDYRMLTDFVNVKFTNTSGLLSNMKYNPVTKPAVISFSETYVPFGNLGDRYIVNGSEGGEWKGKNNKIAQCIDSTSQIWYFFQPVLNDMVLVEDENKKYIYTGSQWFYPEYTIPLTIEVEVIRASNYYGSNIELTNLIVQTLNDTFSPSFGSNIELQRSDIISVVRGVAGVSDCNLIQPQSNIFFIFNVDDFTQDELLSYSPEFIYFTSDNVTIRIIG